MTWKSALWKDREGQVEGGAKANGQDEPGKVPVLHPFGALALRPSPDASVGQGREVPVVVDGEDDDDGDDLESNLGLEHRRPEVEDAGGEEDLRTRGQQGIQLRGNERRTAK